MKVMNKNFLNYLVVSLIFVFFCLLRLDPTRYIWAFPELRLIGPDSYYHLKRIIHNFINYPEMLIFDRFLSYPEGDFVPWPPLFDFLGGTVAKMWGEPVVPSVLLPFFLGLIFFALFLLYLRGKTPFGRLTALTVVSTATSIANIQAAGYIDHHCLEIVLVLAFYFFYEATVKDKWKFPILSIIVCLTFFNWPGAPLYYTPVFLYELFRFFRVNDGRTLFRIIVPFFFTGLVVLLYLVLSEHAVLPYSFRYLSGFQRDFCFLVAGFFSILYLKKKGILSKFTMFIPMFLFFLIFHKLFLEVFGGFAYLGKSAESRLLSLVAETKPLFFSKTSLFFDEFNRNLFSFTPLYLLTPFFIYYLIRVKKIDLCFLAFCYFFFLTIFQIRFGIFYVPFLALISGYVFEELLKGNKIKTVFSVVAILYVVVFSSWRVSHGYHSYDFGKHQLFETMRFLKNKTYDKDRFATGETPYGVLSGWHIGHYIITLGNRPALAHNFIAVARNNKEELYHKAVFAKTEDEIVNIMDQYNAKYMVISDIERFVINSWDLFSDEPNPYCYITDKGTEFTEKMNELFLERLIMAEPTRHLRFVFEAQNINELQSYYGVIERVKGVNILTKERGEIFVNLITPNGEVVVRYMPERENNQYRFVIPYAHGYNGDIYVKSITFKSEKIVKNLDIKEEDVISGNFLNI